MLDTPPMLVELSVMEQRYQAVSFAVHDGESVVEVARRFNVSLQTVHAWLARHERGGLAALADRSHRPRGCAHQMPAAVEAVVLEPGQRLQLRAVGQQGPPTTSICHSSIAVPRSHRLNLRSRRRRAFGSIWSCRFSSR
jgi:transposase-like protein